MTDELTDPIKAASEQARADMRRLWETHRLKMEAKAGHPLTMQELAPLSMVHARSIARYYNATTVPRHDQYATIAKVLGISLDEYTTLCRLILGRRESRPRGSRREPAVTRSREVEILRDIATIKARLDALERNIRAD